MFLDICKLTSKAFAFESLHFACIECYTNRFELRQSEVCEDVLATTFNAHEKVSLCGTHMAFFPVFLFVTLNIRTKFRFLSIDQR